jgi:hypothetical protein
MQPMPATAPAPQAPQATPPAPQPAHSITLLAALSYTARQWHGADGAGYLELIVRDLQKTFVEPIRCTWRGDQAMQFWTAFGAHLRPGRPLHLGVQHIKATHDGQMTARVTSCSLAPLPPSHLKHIQQVNQPNHHQGATA